MASKTETQFTRGVSGQALLFWTLALATVVLSVLYVWLINMSVYSIVERKTLGTENSELSGEIAPLETRYLVLSRAVTLERAHELGFADVVRVEYAKAGESKTALSRSY